MFEALLHILSLQLEGRWTFLELEMAAKVEATVDGSQGACLVVQEAGRRQVFFRSSWALVWLDTGTGKHLG